MRCPDGGRWERLGRRGRHRKTCRRRGVIRFRVPTHKTQATDVLATGVPGDPVLPLKVVGNDLPGVLVRSILPHGRHGHPDLQAIAPGRDEAIRDAGVTAERSLYAARPGYDRCEGLSASQKVCRALGTALALSESPAF